MDPNKTGTAASTKLWGALQNYMSESSAELQAEVEHLRELVVGLSVQVAALETSSAELQSRCRRLEEQVADQRAADFELVSSTISSSPTSVAAAKGPSSSALSSERVSVAKGIGAWINRCLRGEFRGLSGREKIKLGSVLYLVVKGVSGEVFNPPKVTWSWTETKPFVQRSGNYGCSIFIGFPSKEEACLALEETELLVSPALRRP